MVIGFTASQTGNYNVESTRQVNGLNLWLNQVNDAGGITLSDGTVVKFDTVFYDDESNTDRVQELYTRLATDDNADFLISPYSSGLTDASAVIAEQYGKIMITTGAASDSTYKKGYSLVFQTYTPASRYLTGALDLLASLDDSAKKIAIVHENDKFSTDVSNALNDYALSLGYDVVLFEGYDYGRDRFCAVHQQDSGCGPGCSTGRRAFPGRQHLRPPAFREGSGPEFRGPAGRAARTDLRRTGRGRPRYRRPQPMGTAGPDRRRLGGKSRAWISTARPARNSPTPI